MLFSDLAKMVTKHCSYGTCNSDSRKLKKDPGNKIFFVPFPKPHIDAVKCKKWILACKRINFNEVNIKKYSYVCSLHFVGLNGPTALNPDPVPASQSRVIQTHFRLRNDINEIYIRKCL